MGSTPISLDGNVPNVEAASFIAPSAVIAGAVTLESGVNVWFHSVLRAERASIRIGMDTNVQDGCILHCDRGFPLDVGRRVTIGHGAVVHGCTIHDDARIGAGAVILNGAVVGRGSSVAAGGVVPPGMRVDDRTIVGGVPARIIGQDSDRIPRWNIEEYRSLADVYRRKLYGLSGL